jgi:hypothetical protein
MFASFPFPQSAVDRTRSRFWKLWLASMNSIPRSLTLEGCSHAHYRATV